MWFSCGCPVEMVRIMRLCLWRTSERLKLVLYFHRHHQMNRNFSIVDYCFDRLDSIKSFKSCLNPSSASFKLNRVRKRTASFRRYTPPRKKRVKNISSSPKCRKYARKNDIKKIIHPNLLYKRLRTNGNPIHWHAFSHKYNNLTLLILSQLGVRSVCI